MAEEAVKKAEPEQYDILRHKYGTQPVTEPQSVKEVNRVMKIMRDDIEALRAENLVLMDKVAQIEELFVQAAAREGADNASGNAATD